jgi:hypothetical protein
MRGDRIEIELPNGGHGDERHSSDTLSAECWFLFAGALRTRTGGLTCGCAATGQIVSTAVDTDRIAHNESSEDSHRPP